VSRRASFAGRSGRPGATLDRNPFV
jgi:hypothetical protein